MMYSNLENLMEYLQRHPQSNYRKVAEMAEYYLVDGLPMWLKGNSYDCKIEMFFRDILFSEGYV